MGVPRSIATAWSAREGYWQREVLAAPLATLRVVVGLLVAFGAARFVAEGWVAVLLVEPEVMFDFYGFGWLPRPGEFGAYVLYGLLAVLGLAVAAGYRYRMAAPLLLLTFTYAELLDATNYLNHYYLVVLLLGWLCVVPAGRVYAVDVVAGRSTAAIRVPAWCVHGPIAQLCLVYFFAGLAKVNADWLLHAMPLAVWLPEHASLPVIGNALAHPLTAYVASWAGTGYDLTIWAALLYAPTRRWAYVAVLVFHMCTWVLFNIGLFPFIMIGGTLVFFAPSSHARAWRAAMNGGSHLLGILTRCRAPLASQLAIAGMVPTGFSGSGKMPLVGLAVKGAKQSPGPKHRVSMRTRCLLGLFFVVQLALPLRVLAYPGNAAWTEQGYRYGWRVMLVEKFGTAEFSVVCSTTGRRAVVDNGAYLTAYQEKQMAVQPDFIFQFAHVIAADYAQHHGFVKPAVFVSSRVSLNARRSRPLIDGHTNLATCADGLSPKPWILPLTK